MDIVEAEAKRDELYKRLIELNRRIFGATHWGSALTALDEERTNVRRAIKDLEKEIASGNTH